MGDYMGNMQFRYAEEKDAALILEFIKDLAEYENMQKEVVATEELLAEWIFKKEKRQPLFFIFEKALDKIAVSL